MCIISVGTNLDNDVISQCTEPHEQGAGVFAIINDDVIFNKVHVKGRKVRWFMRKNLLGKTSFFLYHSRVPSAGTVSQFNTQPFIDDKRGLVFGHNGTIDRIALMPTLVALKLKYINPNWSDSKLLFEILKRATASTRRALLSILEGNFVVVDYKRHRLELYGHWKRKGNYIRTYYGSDDRDVYYLPIPLKGTSIIRKVRPERTYYAGDDTFDEKKSKGGKYGGASGAEWM